jgi:hypothetical protein
LPLNPLLKTWTQTTVKPRVMTTQIDPPTTGCWRTRTIKNMLDGYIDRFDRSLAAYAAFTVLWRYHSMGKSTACVPKRGVCH